MRIENSFIPVEGIGERTERKLWQAGVTCWDEFDGSVVGPTIADRVTSFVDLAFGHLEAGEARFFGEVFPSGSHWRLYENFREDACFLDIETTGLSSCLDEVTVVGVYGGGESETLVRGRDLSRESLQRVLDPAKLLVTFNGKRFDVPFLEEAFDLDLDVPHVDLLYPCRQIGATGGLKAVEQSIGISRDRPDLSGADAVRLWYNYQRGSDAALETLIEYNKADTQNLEALADYVTAELHERVFEAACAGVSPS